LKIIQKTTVFLILLFSFSVYGFWHDSKILTIHTYLDGGISVYLETQHECGSNRIAFDESAPGFDRVYSSLLSYEAQGKQIRFDITSCNGTVGVVNRIVSIN